MLTFKKHWMQLENKFYLLVDTQEFGIDIPCKKFRVHNCKPGSESVLELNKKLKEHDLIEALQKELKRKDIQLI